MWCVPALLGLAACGGSAATDPEPPGGEEPPSISILRGNDQRAPAGTALSQQIVVLVRDGDGSALPGATVSWTASSGGSFESSTTETDADGLAGTRWTLGATPGEQAATASLGGPTGASVAFTATATSVPSGGQPATVEVAAGGGQVARIGSPVSVAPAVLVKDAEGNPVAGTTVTFAPASGSGTATGAVATTNAQGIATVGSWILGQHGSNSLTVSVQGLSPITITATGRYPYWSVLVYMAADNSLAYPGVIDIEEIEAAIRDPEIQVVVQAEFNAQALAQYGCPGPACLALATFNTFRYVLGGAGTPRIGPDGPVTDIGNRNMASPAELADFIRWARETAPSERVVLVPWNHGGGYTGLLQDEASSPGVLMTMAGLRDALQAAGGPAIDVVDFDMCLMGAYETLITLEGVAKYAVFSEEVTPGAGNDYTRLINALHAINDKGGAAAAVAIADAFYDTFAGEHSSTTISAYDITALGAFDQALSNLASHLGADLATFGPLVSQAASGVLRFNLPEVADVLNFADSLDVRVADPAIRNDIAALRAAGTSASFRLRNRFRNGTVPGFQGTGDVTRAGGLHVLLPDVSTTPTMGDVGPRSLSSYLGTFGNTEWGQFLTAYLGTPAVTNVTDLGLERLETYLVWSTDAQATGVDIDLWVLEPDGTIASPYFGSVSPNGTLTNDSHQSGYPVEGYLTNRFVQNGTYVWYALLVEDPQIVEPQVDLFFRFGDDPFVSIFGTGPYPRLNRAQSVFTDPDPTFGEANGGAYSDFVPVANATFGPAAMVARSGGRTSTGPLLPRLQRGASDAPRLANLGSMVRRPTQQQVATIRALVEQRRSSVRPIQARGMAKLWVSHDLRTVVGR